MGKDQPATHRLAKEARDEITRRVLAGEKAAALAGEFAVSRAYVSLLKATALDPERFKRKAESKLSLKLTEKEIAALKEAFNTSTPEDHDLIPARERWTLELGFQLASKLFNKKPSVRAMRECMGDALKRRPADYDPKPKPPQVKNISQIDPELAKDPTYVAYIQSPVYQKIAWREYELALADWERRHSQGGEKRAAPEDESEGEALGTFPTMPPLTANRRVGKHAKGKGSPFTPPKKRRKRHR